MATPLLDLAVAALAALFALLERRRRWKVVWLWLALAFLGFWGLAVIGLIP